MMPENANAADLHIRGKIVIVAARGKHYMRTKDVKKVNQKDLQENAVVISTSICFE
jgi:hypothetical protein